MAQNGASVISDNGVRRHSSSGYRLILPNDSGIRTQYRQPRGVMNVAARQASHVAATARLSPALLRAIGASPGAEDHQAQQHTAVAVRPHQEQRWQPSISPRTHQRDRDHHEEQRERMRARLPPQAGRHQSNRRQRPRMPEGRGLMSASRESATHTQSARWPGASPSAARRDGTLRNRELPQATRDWARRRRTRCASMCPTATLDRTPTCPCLRGAATSCPTASG